EITFETVSAGRLSNRRIPSEDITKSRWGDQEAAGVETEANWL
ncbi:hypothetical protein AVEN_178614-1, partial [Araneus ventricosus]